MARRKKPAPVEAGPAGPVAKPAGHVVPHVVVGAVVVCRECGSGNVKKRRGNDGGDVGYFECRACTTDDGSRTTFKAVAVAKLWVGKA